MEVMRHIPAVCIPVTESSQVGEARRAATAFCCELGLNQEEQGRASLIATELATNLVKHTRPGGEILLQAAPAADAIDVFAIDRGHGIADPSRCLSDGYSTAGTCGHGLGAVRRAASLFDVFSAPSKGTVVFARVGPNGKHPGNHQVEVGAVCLQKPGEQVCGDTWALQLRPEGAAIAVADGLGHGWGAAEASRAAVEGFQNARASSPRESLERMHGGLRSTRGAAAAVAEVNLHRGLVRYAGVGNIAASIMNGHGMRALISYNGILGHQVQKFHELSYPFEPGSLLVMYSDGINSHVNLEQYSGIASRHAAVIAALLYRDNSRQRDDVTVVVVRGALA